MKQIEHSKDEQKFLLVEVPDVAKRFWLSSSNRLRIGIGGKIKLEILPVGNYEIIGITAHLTEEQAVEVAELANDQLFDFHPHYKDYTSKLWEDDFGTATESLRSLLASHDLKGSTTLILKRQA